MNCHDIFNYTFYPALYPSISTGNSSVGGPGGSNAWKTQEISSEKIQRWELTGSGLILMDELLRQAVINPHIKSSEHPG